MESWLTANARKILTDRYLRKDAEGRHETIEAWLARICAGVARACPSDEARTAGTLCARRLLESGRAILNTPALMSAGLARGQLAACFVLPITDDMGVDGAGIFATLRNAALIQQTGGGIGFDWSSLRPYGDHVESSHGDASGPISFMKVYDIAFNAISRGGSRRCANMGVMRVDHPDIEQFIECKSHSETVLTSFNISIALTDEFMRAVANDAQFSLINPHGGKVARTVRARELMRKIAQGAWVNGEPGVLFIDTINAENAMSHKYTIVATNPCGEQNLGPYENCCLGHVNLAWHCDPSDGSIDWARMRETVRDLVDALNMVIDANYYIPAIPQLRERAFAARRIGLGITGLADVFMLNEIAYGSPESVELAERIACFIRLVAMECSVELAQRDGAFPEFEGSSWSREEVRAEFVSRVARACARGIACTSDVALAQHIMEGIAECGIRNASILTVAPTGTTSLILGVEGYGCEPIFSLAYSRTLGDGSRMQFCSELARRVAARYVSGVDLESVCEEIRDKGCAPDCAAIPQIARDAIGATALRVAPAQHLAIQAALQRWVDSSISKTINCPHETTVEEVEKMYLDAWKLRLKGVAIYRSGSRTSEVLTVPAAAPAAAPAAPTRSSEVHRPPYVCGGTYRCEASFGHVFTTVNTITDESGIAPFEVFIAVGKSGSDIQADSEAIGRLISTILRLNSTVPPVERLGMVIAQLRNIGGSRGHRDSQTKAMIQSLPDAVAFSLSEVMKLWSARDEVASITAHVSRDCDICPECGATALRRVERCKKCSECGYSAC
jgi:ribonucleoside-diphosphate reductase alpha chain